MRYNSRRTRLVEVLGRRASLPVMLVARAISLQSTRVFRLRLHTEYIEIYKPFGAGAETAATGPVCLSQQAEARVWLVTMHSDLPNGTIQDRIVTREAHVLTA